jgi:Chaperone of endosialidase
MQFDFGTIDPNVKTGSELAADLNQWRTALHSTHAGVARPAYAAPGMLWVDQASATDWKLKLATATGDVIVGGVNTTTNQLAPARFPDGTASAPGISWLNEATAGFVRTSAGNFKYFIGGNSVFGWNATEFTVAPTVTTYLGPVTCVSQVRLLNGYAGGLLDFLAAPIRLDGQPGLVPGMSFNFAATNGTLNMDGGGWLRYGTNAQSGPAGIANFSMLVNPTGAIHARSFNVTTLAASAKENVAPLTDSLSSLLKLHGVRYRNEETQRTEIGLDADSVETVFPELLDAAPAGMGKGVDLMALTGPIIEAIRELDARLRSLEIPA